MKMINKVALVLAVAGVGGCCGILGLWGISKRPSYCGWCHVMEPYYRSWTASEFLARRHSDALIKCQDCHPHTIGKLVHEIVSTARGTYREPLPSLRMTKQQCLSCHGDYASLARATASLKINPHASHLGEEECYQCHKMHRASPGVKFCYTCHHTGTLERCSKCHPDK
jgi:cytochrome c nitrite reductase small subunit